MTVYTARHRYPWRTGEYAGIGLFALLTIAAVVLLFTHVLNPVFAGVLIGAFALITVIALFLNLTPKRNSTLNANMNSDTWDVEWWAKKPLVSVWGRKLNRLDNTGNLDNTLTFEAKKVGIHDVFEFRLRGGKYLYLPARLAETDGVRDFLLAWVQHQDNQFPAYDQASAEKFVAVLNRGKNFSPMDEDPATGQDAVDEKVEVPVVVEERHTA